MSIVSVVLRSTKWGSEAPGSDHSSAGTGTGHIWGLEARQIRPALRSQLKAFKAYLGLPGT